MVKQISGNLALLSKPFTEDYKINEDALRREIDWVIGKGADGIIVTGSVGEFVHLTDEERMKVFKICIDQISGGKLAVASTSAAYTLQTIEITKQAEDLGYDGAMVVPPYYWRCSEEEVYRHYEMIAEHTDIPLILYHNPDLSKFYMRPEFVLKLTKIPQVVAIKEVVTDVQHLQKLMALIGDKINVLQYTTGFLTALMLGAEGGTIDPFFITPAIKCKEALENGHLMEAVEIQQKMMSVYPSISGEAATGALGWFKAGVSIATGIDMGPPRPPYLPLTGEEYLQLEKRLKMILSE